MDQSVTIAEGIEHHRAGRLREAEKVYRQILRQHPDHADALHLLGVLAVQSGQSDVGVTLIQHAIAICPTVADYHCNLGMALAGAGRFDDAIDAFRQSIALKPDYIAAMSYLGMTLKQQGRTDEAAECYGRLGEFNEEAQSQRLLLLHFLPQWDGQAILRELTAWGDAQTQRMASDHPGHQQAASNNRLRIGYITADFSGHVAGRNALPLLREHDRERFEIFCYSNATTPDAITRRFQSFGHAWRDLARLGDEQAASLVIQDEIDILVDLAVHSAGNRLPVLARKPAPVQVTFCGYPGGTGLKAVDYRLTDPYLDSPENDALYREQSIRLERSFWCYDEEAMELAQAPQVNAAPLFESGQVTFGCLNSPCKVNRPVLELWWRVLDAVPGSRMLLLGMPGARRQQVAEQLQGRADFEAFRGRREYLELYHRIDIGLDTLPYNGHTTSLDSLWMGVPVVTQVGQTAVGRAGWSQLNNLQLTELAATTADEFVRIAISLAGDISRLRKLRSTLRDRMKSSPLVDAVGFTRDVERAYQRIWRTWNASQTSRRD